jgi:hypothetical protein
MSTMFGWRSGRRGGNRKLGRLGLALAVAAVAALTAACTGSPTGVSQSELEGKWRWVRSTGGITGGVRTPDTEGHGYELEFEGDSVVLRRPGVLEIVAWTGYTLGVGEEETALAGQNVIRYEVSPFGFDEQAIDRVGDELTLTDPCCDGFTWEFVKR